VNEVTDAGKLSIHWRPAAVPAPDVNERDIDAVEPGETVADDAVKLEVAPKEV
jgi:hypothetical protein